MKVKNQQKLLNMLVDSQTELDHLQTRVLVMEYLEVENCGGASFWKKGQFQRMKWMHDGKEDEKNQLVIQNLLGE